MKVKTTLIALSLIGFSVTLLAQEAIQFSPKDLKHFSKRWSKYQPKAEVLLHNGDTIKGQPIHFNMEEFYIFPADSLPLILEGQLKVIPSEEIDRIWLTRGGTSTAAQTGGVLIGIGVGTGLGILIGGPIGGFIGGNIMGAGLGLSGKAIYKSASNEEIWLDSSSQDYEDDLLKLRNWSVFEDSLFFTGDLEKLPGHSAVVRRAFPQKHLRITLGLNGGINGLEKDMLNAIQSSGLPPWDFYSQDNLGFEYLDLSWRFNYHWIIGGGIMTNRRDMVYTSFYGNDPLNTQYTYSVNQSDFRIYMEYAFSPVNRFLTDRTEFLVGGGAIISKPIASFNYSYYYPDTGYYDNYSSIGPNTLFGFQFRAEYYFYLFRNFSLSGGAELNLYQNLKMPALEISSDEIFLDAHTLNYSAVRFKLGAHLYF